MTQLRHCKCGISNYFDTVLKGIGHRGSSFSDIDAVSHDGPTGRFLVQEFKREREALDPAVHWMLKDLAALPQHFTVWHVVKRDDGQIGFALFGGMPLVISVKEYQERFAAWWAHREYVPTQTLALPVHPPVAWELTAEDITWG